MEPPTTTLTPAGRHCGSHYPVKGSQEKPLTELAPLAYLKLAPFIFACALWFFCLERKPPLPILLHPSQVKRTGPVRPGQPPPTARARQGEDYLHCPASVLTIHRPSPLAKIMCCLPRQGSFQLLIVERYLKPWAGYSPATRPPAQVI